ncbi:MAG TPA: hypothetical protein VL131_01930 [Gammaproteobacteria bacterium]|nr:hypothetical protein [Gammaproteobacteria bacterium]
MFAVDAAFNDYRWSDAERSSGELLTPGHAYSRMASARRRFSILHPWGLIRPILSDVWYVDEREIVHFDENRLLLEVLEDGRESTGRVRMGIDLDTERCVTLPWKDRGFEEDAKSYIREGLLADWQPCQDTALMHDSISYLRSDYGKRIAPALTFLRALRRRLAAQPTADDIDLLSLTLTVSGTPIADPSEGLKLFCDVLSDAEKGGRALVVVPKADPNEYHAPGYLDAWARLHGRVPIDNVPPCLPVTRAAIRWQESVTLLPGRPYNWHSNGNSGRVLLQDAVATGTLEVFDGSDVRNRQEIVAKAAWPSDQQYLSSSGAPPETTKERDALEKLHAQLSATLVPDFVTPAAPVSRDDERAAPRLQTTFCFALVRILRGHLADGMDVIAHLPSSTLPSDVPYIARATDYFNDRVTAPRDSPANGASPICPSQSVLTNIIR